MIHRSSNRGFTLLELLVAVSVTALLAAMLFNITSQVVTTHGRASGDLETNQVAQFVLDQIQEDLQCALFKNDGNVWMAASVLENKNNSGSWSTTFEQNGKPQALSIRLTDEDWQNQGLQTDEISKANNQGPLSESRFGLGGVWLRFFTQSRELDPEVENYGGARAIAYQIVRYGLLGDAQNAQPRYQLFRSDVTEENTLLAGFNLDPEKGDYVDGDKSDRQSGNIRDPILLIDNKKSTAFSLAANVIDFGIRAYLINRSRTGTGYLKQIFPFVENYSAGSGYEMLCSVHPDHATDPSKLELNAFPEVVDVMIRVLTTEGASAIAAYERGLVPKPSGFSGSDEEYWWALAEENSEVFIRRVRIFSSGI